jgi:hypothetical protein
MPALGNTFISTSAKVNRESLDNVVKWITPEDTPIYSMIGKGSVDSTHPEWAIDTLTAPGANVQTEGDEFTFGAVTPVVRVGNYTQIFRKDFIVSETQEAIKNAGDAEKTKRNIVKKGIEIRKDVEFSIISNVASLGGAARVSGGLPSWLTTNTSRFTGGVNGGFSQGTGFTVAETKSTAGPPNQRAFTKALMDSIMGSAYSAGADVRSVVLSPYNKSVFVSFMSDPAVAAFRYNADKSGQKTLISNADVYEGPYGTVTVKPNRVMAVSAETARRVFFIDPDMMSWEWLRKIHKVPDVAKTGDAVKTVIIGEGCLKVDNEAAHGIIADVFGLTAST